MKKLIPVAALAVFAMMFTSCKKDYTCTCTWTFAGTSQTVTGSLGKTTKSKAQDACNTSQTNYNNMAGYTSVTCHI